MQDRCKTFLRPRRNCSSRAPLPQKYDSLEIFLKFFRWIFLPDQIFHFSIFCPSQDFRLDIVLHPSLVIFDQRCTPLWSFLYPLLSCALGDHLVGLVVEPTMPTCHVPSDFGKPRRRLRKCKKTQSYRINKYSFISTFPFFIS